MGNVHSGDETILFQAGDLSSNAKPGLVKIPPQYQQYGFELQTECVHLFEISNLNLQVIFAERRKR